MGASVPTGSDIALARRLGASEPGASAVLEPSISVSTSVGSVVLLALLELVAVELVLVTADCSGKGLGP